MYDAKKDGMPTPITTLDELVEAGDTAEHPQKVFIGHNLGSRSFLMTVPMHEFFRLSQVANDQARDGDTVAQRKLDPAHAQKLAVYLLKGLVAAAIEFRRIKKMAPLDSLEVIRDHLGKQPYLGLQPIVVNIRECDPSGTDIRGFRLSDKDSGETAAFKVFLTQRHILWVVDGQHRRRAMELLFDFLEEVIRQRTYPKKGSLYEVEHSDVAPEELQVWQACYDVARSFCTVAVEVHLGLQTEQERQLFHDLNNLGKKVEKSLALQFDNSNPVNLFIKEKLMDAGLGIRVSEKDAREWKDDKGEISWKDVVAVNAILFLNKTNIGGATPADVQTKVDTAVRFWEAVKAIHGWGEEGAKESTVAAQPVMLKALAKLVYDFAFNARRDDGADLHLEKLLAAISDFDFSHTNPLWRYYEMTPDERKAKGIADLETYLPTTEGNRDIGSFQDGVMRFGAKHNDIYPILGDMIRWKLGLPNRNGPEI